MYRFDRDKILEDRDGDLGSRWDDKIHVPSGKTYPDLRYAVGNAVVRGKKSCRDTAGIYHVSLGFVSYWSRVYRARDETNSPYGGTKYNRISESVFRSLSNRPRRIVRPVQKEIRDAVVERRRKYPFEGAARIKAGCGLTASPATINKVLRREKLIGDPKPRRRGKTYGSFERPWTMSLLQLDFKHWNYEVKSIWAMDDRSRYICGMRVTDSTSAAAVVDLMEEVVARYGSPAQVLSDHGSEFYSIRGGKGRSAFDRWCRENGIEHITGRVRHPQTQGKVERSHRSAEEEIPHFGSMATPEEAAETVRKWVQYYNWERPHQALDYKTPGVVFMSMLGIDITELAEI